VLLRANAAVWIEVREGADKRILSRVLRAGETFPVPARPGLTLTTGNAGGLDIMVDGKAIPPLGPIGEVRRDIALDAGALLSGAR
jgi:cytoskeleton protein RodZ